MKLKRISVNVRELIFADGTRLLISYDTPVALYRPTDDKYIETSKKWSSSTTRQINKWWRSIGAPYCEYVDQEILNAYLKGTNLEHFIGKWKEGIDQTYPVRDFNQQQRGV